MEMTKTMLEAKLKILRDSVAFWEEYVSLTQGTIAELETQLSQMVTEPNA